MPSNHRCASLRSIGKLPLNIIELVIDTNLMDFARGARGKESGKAITASNVYLARLCRVSSAWQALAQPKLYNTLRFNNSKQGKRLLRRIVENPVAAGLVKCIRIIGYNEMTASDILRICSISISSVGTLHVSQQTYCEAKVASRITYGVPLPLPYLTHLTYECGPCTHLAQLLSHLPHLTHLKIRRTHCESAHNRTAMPHLLAQVTDFDTMLPIFVPEFGLLPDFEPPACRLQHLDSPGICGDSMHLAWLMQSSAESLRSATLDHFIVGFSTLVHVLANVQVISLLVDLSSGYSYSLPSEPAPDLCAGLQELPALDEIHIFPRHLSDSDVWPVSQILAICDTLTHKKITIHHEAYADLMSAVA
ncbi:hypothetical protein EMMF5_002674 [Cystobasidiomycetes sp. EMM_F5]